MRTVCALACAAAAAVTLRAETVLAVPTASGSEATIKVALASAQPPRFGFAPVRVTVENAAAQDRSWRFQFQSGTRQFPGSQAFERTITVPAGQTRDTWVYVPVAEPGTPGGEPVLSVGGIAAPPAAPGGPSSPKVTITRTPTGTKVLRTMYSGFGSGAPIFTEETDIDATTGELRSTTTTGNGTFRTSTNSRSTTPPPGSTVTYRIDSTTGTVTSNYTSTGRSGSGPTKVNIVTDPGRPGGGSAAAPTAMTPTKVTVEPTPVGTRVTRVIGSVTTKGVNRGYTEEREIDAQTGVITTTTTPPGGSPMPPRTTPPLNPGTETTFTINPNTGTISTTTRIGANPTAPPKVTIVTTPSTVATLPTVKVGAATRIVPATYNGPPMVLSVEVSGPGLAANTRVTFTSLGSAANMRPMAATLALERVLRDGLNIEGIRTPTLTAIDLALVPADWRAWAVAEKEGSSTWLTIFLVLFAVVIGPVNLYVFAPAAKRHRLFITTPLISLAAAIVLGLTIVGQDGTGGDGLRRALVVLVPGDNQAAVFQEQAAATGFLASQSFALAGDTQLTLLPLEDPAIARMGGFNTAPDLTRDDARASGGWFRSRGRQAHLVQRLVPTRGRVERVGTGPGGAPIVQSSLGGVLRDFVCVDDKGERWSIRELAPGRRVTLEAGGLWIAREQMGGTKRFAQVFAAATPMTAGHWGAKGGDGELTACRP
ncbi:MAG: hypothetical protein NTV51_04290 [Verrucomicrobia bacterium]|nr:hypothetical protein [Verrucomicrobiota bacterium]